MHAAAGEAGVRGAADQMMGWRECAEQPSGSSRGPQPQEVAGAAGVRGRSGGGLRSKGETVTRLRCLVGRHTGEADSRERADSFRSF